MRLINFFLILILAFSSFASATLGISPAIKEFNFVPGQEINIDYTIISDKFDQELEIYLTGDLAEFATLSKTEMIGPGNFKVNFKIPESLDKPGQHNLGVGIREIPSESEFLGTAINVIGVVKIFVPYPGRYAEASLNIPNANVGDKVPIESKVINRGKESLNLDVKIDFFTSSGGFVETMDFKPVVLESGQERFFRKFLDTESYRPGDYVAEAVVDYGEIVKVNQTFRVGSLFVNITNFTQRLVSDKIQEFIVDVESLWNNNIEDIYADVNISNDTASLSFRTPPENLGSWEIKKLVGFVDTEGFKGEYDVNIILNYEGKESTRKGSLTIFEESRFLSNILLIILLIIGVILVLLVAILFILKSKRKKHRERK